MVQSSRYLCRIVENFTSSPEAEYCTIVEGGEELLLSWDDLRQDCQSVISALGENLKGVVLIFLRHGRWLHGTFFGVMLAGGIPSFMPCTSEKQDNNLYWKSHQELINHINPTAIITDVPTQLEMDEVNLNLGGANLILIDNLEPANDLGEFQLPSDDEVALLQHSSGTTGLKKGVALTHESVLFHAESYISSLIMNGGDKIISWLPLYHDMGLMACMLTPAYNKTPVLHINPFEWVSKPQIMLELIEEKGGTLTWMPNFAFEHMAIHARRNKKLYDLSSMRAWISCSEVCRPESFDKFEKAYRNNGVTLANLHTCYAMAETVFAVSQSSVSQQPMIIKVDKLNLNRNEQITILDESSELSSRRLIEAGSILEGLEVNIIDEEGKLLDELFIGEIQISGTFLFDGYYKNPILTNQRLKSGWFDSKDIGFKYLNKLFVLGRVDDLIIIQGRNVYAHQVEALVSTIDGVKPGRVSAFGIHDSKVGSETLILVCEKNSSVEAISNKQIKTDIINIIFSTIEVIPKKIVLVEPGWLVKTSSGKVSRKENKAKYKRI